MAPVMPVQPGRLAPAARRRGRVAAMAGDVETADDAVMFLFYRNLA
jgi:hypothetical protein